jgi:hypothetical protein
MFPMPPPRTTSSNSDIGTGTGHEADTLVGLADVFSPTRFSIPL